jgi:hypothetical protein
MIIIVASRYDAPARRLKDRWAAEGAHLLTCQDLSVSGWRCRVSDPLGGTAIIDGLDVKQTEIRGVLTRMQWVAEQELTHIVAHDRAYISTEMSAFLVFWLSGLTCPFLNRPTANSLSGPGWGREAWNSAAFKAGMRINPIRRRASLMPESLMPESLGPESRALASSGDLEVRDQSQAIVLTVVGDACLGDADNTLKQQARRLAEIAHMDFLNVRFSSVDADAGFVGVDLLPDIDDGIVADAALGYFGRASAPVISNRATAAAIG